MSADEKTSIQARPRRPPGAPPGPGAPQRGGREDARGGALADPAARDARAGGVGGRCGAPTGMAACGRLVAQVMPAEPSRSAPRVFRIVADGRSHRGGAAAADPARRHPAPILVHLPTHASRLDQIEVSFSIVQRKALTPTDFADLAAAEDRLRAFAAPDNDAAVPFHRRFTRADLEARLVELATADEAGAPLPQAA